MDQYDSFMVRIWRRRNSGDQEWIGRVEHIQDHQTHRFHDPEELIAYLREQFAPEPPMGRARRGGAGRMGGAEGAYGNVAPLREQADRFDHEREDPALFPDRAFRG